MNEQAKHTPGRLSREGMDVRDESDFRARAIRRVYITREADDDAQQQELVAAQERAIAALLDFASTVAGGASWWDDVWPEHEAALDAARKGGSNG